MDMDLNIRHPQNLKNPFPLFSYLRAHQPVFWSESLDGWMITRYADVRHVLHHPLRYSSDRFRQLKARFTNRRPAVMDVVRVLQDWMVMRDPPDHTRLRRLLHNSFTPARLRKNESLIQGVVDDLLDQLEEREEMEFIQDFAFPLPAAVITMLMGVPREDIPAIREWSDQLAAYLGGAQTAADNMETARDGILKLADYFRELIRGRKTDTAEDLIDLMRKGGEDGERLSEDEMIANCVLLLFAGHETTTNLLGNGLFHLLCHPAQYKLLASTPALVPTAVEEFLRYDASVPAILKVTREDVKLQGQHIPAGDTVLPFLAAANRDDAQFERSEELDITRKSNRHLAFAHGIHFCLGAPLARLEAKVAFTALFQRLEGFTLLDKDPPWLPQIFLRGVASMPIAFHAKPRKPRRQRLNGSQKRYRGPAVMIDGLGFGGYR